MTHRLREEERAVLVVECEPSNPDVFKVQSEVVQCETVDLHEADGWIRLASVMPTLGPSSW